MYSFALRLFCFSFLFFLIGENFCQAHPGPFQPTPPNDDPVGPRDTPLRSRISNHSSFPCHASFPNTILFSPDPILTFRLSALFDEEMSTYTRHRLTHIFKSCTDINRREITIRHLESLNSREMDEEVILATTQLLFDFPTADEQSHVVAVLNKIMPLGVHVQHTPECVMIVRKVNNRQKMQEILSNTKQRVPYMTRRKRDDTAFYYLDAFALLNERNENPDLFIARMSAVIARFSKQLHKALVFSGYAALPDEANRQHLDRQILTYQPHASDDNTIARFIHFLGGIVNPHRREAILSAHNRATDLLEILELARFYNPDEKITTWLETARVPDPSIDWIPSIYCEPPPQFLPSINRRK